MFLHARARPRSPLALSLCALHVAGGQWWRCAGEIFSIRLPGNPTTGYSWALVETPSNKEVKEGSSSCLTLRGATHVTDAHPDGLVGVGGHDYLAFEAGGPCKLNVPLHYVRPWEKNTSGDTKSFHVTVLPSKKAEKKTEEKKTKAAL